MVDVFGLYRIVQRLMDDGETFDPADARELFAALPEERLPTFQNTSGKSRCGRGFEGLTNLGSFSFDEKDEEPRSLSRRYGMWIGQWSVMRDKDTIRIQHRFIDPDAPPDTYYLMFGKDGEVSFKKLYYRTLSISIPIFRLDGWRPYLAGWGIFRIGSGHPRLWKRPIALEEYPKS